MTVRTLSGALALGLLVAACEGDRIGPPDPVPNTEGTVQLDGETPPPPPDGFEAPIDPVPGEETVPPQNPAAVQEGLREASEEAQERAREIFEEVMGEGEQPPGEAQTPPPAQTPAPQTTPTPQSTAPVDPNAMLRNPLTLQSDTIGAAQYDAAGSGLGYVGAWATRVQDCDLVDRHPFTDYAVITPTSMRIGGASCSIDARPILGGSATVPAACTDRGVSENRTYRMTMADTTRLTVTDTETNIDQDFVRCTLPG